MSAKNTPSHSCLVGTGWQNNARNNAGNAPSGSAAAADSGNVLVYDCDARLQTPDNPSGLIDVAGKLLRSRPDLTQLKKALQQAHLLLQTVAIRTAPQSLKELGQGSNMTTRNAAYLHPDVLKLLGLNAAPGVSLQNVLGSQCLIACTPLLPTFGVIYGPLYDLFLGDEQKSEEFEQHWNVAKLHRAGAQQNFLPQSTQRNAEEQG